MNGEPLQRGAPLGNINAKRRENSSVSSTESSSISPEKTKAAKSLSELVVTATNGDKDASDLLPSMSEGNAPNENQNDVKVNELSNVGNACSPSPFFSMTEEDFDTVFEPLDKSFHCPSNAERKQVGEDSLPEAVYENSNTISPTFVNTAICSVVKIEADVIAADINQTKKIPNEGKNSFPVQPSFFDLLNQN